MDRVTFVKCNAFNKERIITVDKKTIKTTLPVEVGDLVLNYQPLFIKVDISKKNILRHFARWKLPPIYDTLKQHGKVHTHLCSLAEQWHHSHNMDILTLCLNNVEQAQVLLENWHRFFNLRPLYLLGLTDAEIEKYPYSCQEIYNKCIINPYLIYTLPIHKCHTIMDLLMKPREYHPLSLTIREIYNNVITKHWSCTPGVVKEIGDYDLIVDNHFTYIKYYHEVEQFIVQWIKQLLATDCKDMIPYPAVCDAELSDDQCAAIQGGLDRPLSIITAGAGYGKTRVIAEIIKNLDMRHLNYILCSFTGKAVSKLREVTHVNALTMHKLIYNAKSVPCEKIWDYVIIDEVSMVTTDLMYQFLQHYKMHQVILVGDVNQLEPIEAGSFLHQLIKSSVVPTYYLTKNHRQVEGDGISLNATNMLKSPFQFIETDNFNIIEGNLQSVLTIVKSFYRAGISVHDFVVITPYNCYLAELNQGIQAIYNPIGSSTNFLWRVNDKVMLLKNITEKNIFNGLQGTVTAVSKLGVIVDFKEFNAHTFYFKGDMNVSLLQHCYALTIDKDQGSDHDYVIGYLGKNSSFLNRNRIYTLITRAKKACWIVTPSKTFLNAAANQLPLVRHDCLHEKLKLI